MKIRPARPTHEDGLAFARFLDLATEGLMELMLGSAMAERVAAAFVEPANEVSWENALVAEVDGEPLAMAAGFDAPTQRGFPDDPLTPPRGLARLRYLSIGFALWPCLRQIGRMEEGDFYVFAIATAPEARGLGLGTRLLEETEGRARAAGCARLALDVAHANEGAQRLYRRRGFAVAGQPSWWVPKRLRIVRMTRRLGPAASQGSGGAGEF